jgi:hypothetical protein
MAIYAGQQNQSYPIGKQPAYSGPTFSGGSGTIGTSYTDQQNLPTAPNLTFGDTATNNYQTSGLGSFNAYRGLYEQNSMPQMTALLNGRQNLIDRQGNINTNYGMQRDYLNQGYGNQMGQLRVNADTNMYDQNVVNQLMGQNTASYNNLLSQFGLQEADARNQSDVKRRAAASDAIARGAYGGAGTGQDFTDISSALANQLGMYGAKREGAGIDYKTETINLQKRRNDLTQQGKIYGLQGEQFGIALQQGLAKLNLDNILSVGNILDQINSKDQATAALMSSIVERAMAASSIQASDLSQITL